MSLDYPLFQSKVDVHSEQFAANVESMQPLLERLSTQQQLAANEGSERTIARHRKLGKLMPRERVELLLDEDSPFLEICPLAGIEQDGYAPGSTTFAGIGLVCGVECVITSNRYTIKGGTIDEASLRRSGRAAEIAHENNLPCIMLVESGGANLTQQFKVFKNIFFFFLFFSNYMFYFIFYFLNQIFFKIYFNFLDISYWWRFILQHHSTIGKEITTSFCCVRKQYCWWCIHTRHVRLCCNG